MAGDNRITTSIRAIIRPSCFPPRYSRETVNSTGVFLMTRTRILWIAIGVLVLLIAAFLIPGSPLYITRVHKPEPGDQVEGKSKSYWMENLNSPDRTIRLDAIRAMGQFGASARDATPTLAKIMLEDSEPAFRNEAALALGKMIVPEAVPALAQALEDPEASVRINACFALSRLRKEARPALQALVKALNAKENDTNAKTFHFTIQEMAALSIGRATAGTPDGVPVLIEALSTASSIPMRRAIARAFGEIGAEARPAVPHLRKLLKDSNRSLKEAAEEALQAIGADPKEDKEPTKATGNVP